MAGVSYRELEGFRWVGRALSHQHGYTGKGTSVYSRGQMADSFLIILVYLLLLCPKGKVFYMLFLESLVSRMV